MPFTISRRVAALLLSAVVMAPGLASAATEPPIPVEHFFRHPALKQPQLSPDGKHLAMIVPSTIGDGRLTLAVASVDNPQKLTAIAHSDEIDVWSFHWVNDKRLVFDVLDKESPIGNQVHDPGLYAVNLDGSDFMVLVGNQDTKNIAQRPLRSLNHRFHSVLRDGSDDVILERYNLRETSAESQSSTLVRLNTRTRAHQDLTLFGVPEGAHDWVLDRQNPRQARALMTTTDRTTRAYAREVNSKEWTQIAEFDAFEGGNKTIVPFAFDGQGRFYVVAGQDNPEQTSAVYRYDIAKRQREADPLVTVKGFDFDGGLIVDGVTGKLLGIRYTSDAMGVVWVDPDMKALQEVVDKKLPHTNNLISCNRCSKDQLFVVTAYSDRLSPVYFLFDRTSSQFKLIGSSRPWIDDRQMAESDFTRFAARDGLSIPVLVTKPKGKGPWPTVVLVHGGPYVRGVQWGWQPDSQFLASRGYLVVEPEFRGSEGYGYKHFRAGWKQWGLSMQDDVTDATKWAIRQGWADPKRIAIAGASYGGYATMMGLVKEPDLYRAGINWVGVTDIELMYDIGWSDFAGGDWQKYGMPRLVGDYKKDKEQLDSTSPLKRATEITKPVFMAYGEDDYRVPMPHGTKMRDALKKAGKVEVEWVVYEDEGHGWLLVKNNVDFWTRVEKFLARHMQ